MSKDILVIGGGIAGLTAAIETAEAGYNVVLVEKYRGKSEDRDLGLLLRYLEILGSIQDIRAVDKKKWRQTVTSAH